MPPRDPLFGRVTRLEKKVKEHDGKISDLQEITKLDLEDRRLQNEGTDHFHKLIDVHRKRLEINARCMRILGRKVAKLS